MTKLLTISALVLSLSGGMAFAQDTDVSGGGGADNTGASSGDASGTADTTNAPNAPFLGNRDNVGMFYSDEGMTVMLEGDEFATAYNALTDEQRAAITEQCASPAGFERFCDAFTNQGTTTQQ